VRARPLILTVVLSALAAGSLQGQALGPSAPGPVIRDFGPVFQVENPDFATPMGDYKAVFDVSQGAEGPDQRNARIETLARFLNMHAQAGVPRENMKLALVLHGSAGKDALGHDGYRKRYGIDNPNYDMIQSLHAFGVRIVLCGQTQMNRGLRRDELASGVEVALSAMTALVALQSQGYNLISF